MHANKLQMQQIELEKNKRTRLSQISIFLSIMRYDMSGVQANLLTDFDNDRKVTITTCGHEVSAR